jgi:CrcB protein
VATLLINVLGSFVIGAFAALTTVDGRFSENESIRLLVMVGVCGGFTTFSSFSLQTLMLLRAGDTLSAGINVVASVVLCLLATSAAMALFTRV